MRKRGCDGAAKATWRAKCLRGRKSLRKIRARVPWGNRERKGKKRGRGKKMKMIKKRISEVKKWRTKTHSHRWG